MVIKVYIVRRKKIGDKLLCSTVTSVRTRDDNVHNLLERNRLVQSKQGETGLMFDYCDERFSNIRLCSIGKIWGEISIKLDYRMVD